MKKTLSVILALAMMFTLTAVAFATDDTTLVEDEGNGTSDKNVTATYDEPTTSGDDNQVYYVTVSWEENSNTLHYAAGDTEYAWDGATMKYVEVEDPEQPTGQGWEGTAQYTVTVTNQSNAEITAAASWKATDGLTIKCEFDEENVKLGSAAEGITPGQAATGTAKEGKIVADITPESGAITQNNAVVGVITVTVAPVVEP